MHTKYVVYSKEESVNQDEPMFWSNMDGWGTLEGSTHFTEHQTKHVNLPIVIKEEGDSVVTPPAFVPLGEWVTLEKAKEIVANYVG